MSRALVGTVRLHPSGAYGVKKPDGAWFAVPGSVVEVAQFVPAFGGFRHYDEGKQVWRVDGIFQMENDEQRAARLAP